MHCYAELRWALRSDKRWFALKGADLLALICGVLLWVCYFPIGILGQVWYLIVSIPDFCTLICFDNSAESIGRQVNAFHCSSKH